MISIIAKELGARAYRSVGVTSGCLNGFSDMIIIVIARGAVRGGERRTKRTWLSARVALCDAF